MIPKRPFYKRNMDDAEKVRLREDFRLRKALFCARYFGRPPEEFRLCHTMAVAALHGYIVEWMQQLEHDRGKLQQLHKRLYNRLTRQFYKDDALVRTRYKAVQALDALQINAIEQQLALYQRG